MFFICSFRNKNEPAAISILWVHIRLGCRGGTEHRDDSDDPESTRGKHGARADATACFASNEERSLRLGHRSEVLRYGYAPPNNPPLNATPEDSDLMRGSCHEQHSVDERSTRSLTVSLLTVPQPGHPASFRPGATPLLLASPRPHVHRTAQTLFYFHGPFLYRPKYLSHVL
jgi:hypothetical protein